MNSVIRSMCIFISLITFLGNAGCICAQDKMADAFKKKQDLRLLRKKASHRQRRIIQNNDGCDILFYCKEASSENLLNIWTKGLEDSQVDTLYYTIQTGIGSVMYNSKVATPITATSGNFKDNMLGAFLENGLDPLEIISDFCRKNDMEIFASFRMNDIHSGDLEKNGELCDPELHSPWKTEHPEYLLGSREKAQNGERLPYFHQHRGWAAANYELEPVRDYVYQTIEEVCKNYDIDGIELDFFRHPLFFKSHVLQGKVGDKERAIMTGFLRRLRSMMDQESLRKGHALLISIRVPDSVGYCSDIGLDVEEWLKEGLVDILVPGGYFQLQPWENSVELGHKYDVPVYPCLDDSRELDGNSPFLKNSVSSYYGRAQQVWSSGADGVYLFNAIYPFNPNHVIYDQLGDPQILSKQSRNYFVNVLRTDIIDGFLSGSRDRYLKLPELNKYQPMVLLPGQSKSVSLDTGTKPNESAVLKLELNKTVTKSDLLVMVNGKVMDQSELSGNWLTIEIKKENIKEGINCVEIKNKSEEKDLKVFDFQLRID